VFTLTVDPKPGVNLDGPANICEGEVVTLTYSFSNASTITWETSGSGIFEDDLSDPSIKYYTPSYADIQAGSVTLTAKTNDPDGPCGIESDYVEVTINPCSEINLTKITINEVDPTADDKFQFDLYGIGGYGGQLITSIPDVRDDGSLYFDGIILSYYQSYTICERNVPAGWGTYWKIDTDGDGSAETIVHPYNPDYDPNPEESEDLGNRCFDFGNGTGYPLLTTDWSNPLIPIPLVFEVTNKHPGGEPRTPGFWKNWNTCTGGNQALTAAENGGADAGWYILDDVLSNTIYLGQLELDGGDCVDAQLILNNRDLRDKNRASDPAYNLAKHLLTYKLNLGAGSYMCPDMAQAVSFADWILNEIGFDGIGAFLKFKGNKISDEDKQLADWALALAAIFDDYNNFDPTVGNECTTLASAIAALELPPVPSRIADGTQSVDDGLEILDDPTGRIMLNAYPNPFRDFANFEFSIPFDGKASLDIYTIEGRHVTNLFNDDVVENAVYKAYLDAATLPAAMYIYRLTTDKGAKYGTLIPLNR
jgi:hypothetical protein